MSNSIQRNNQPQSGALNKFEYVPLGNFYEKETNSLDPRRILSFLMKYKWVVLAFLLAGATAAWFYAESVTPVYESTGTLMVTSGDNSPTDELSKIISQTTGFGTSSTLENELQILKSRIFSKQVAQRLIEEEPEDIETYPIYWQFTENGDRVRTSVDQMANDVRNNIGFYHAVEEADVVKVTYQSSSPKEAAKVVNLAMQNYIDNSTRQNRKAASSTADFLSDEKEKIQNKLQNAEQQLRSYMDATGIVQVNEQATGMVNQRATTGVELQHVNLELQAIEESIADYKAQLEQITPGLTEQLTEAVGPRIKASQEMLARYEQERGMILAKNPGVLKRDPLPARLQYLDKEITRLKEEITGLSSKLFSSDNEFMGMNSEDRAEIISNLQGRLVELEIQRNQLKSRQQALSQHMREMDAEFNTLPEGMVELAKLKRDVRINEELYVNVSKQYADMSILQQSQYGFGRVIDPANIPSFAVSPNKKIFVLLGLMFGGMLAAGFIAVREFRDNSINSIGEMKTIYLPPLTVIPGIEKVKKEDQKIFKKGEGNIPDEMVMLHDRTSITAEAVRRLKNNIIYQNGELPPKTIVVTSPEKGDGKSTVSANLAIAFAEEGFWTLLVDADFRRPKLQKYFGINNEKGLSNYLSDEMPFDDLLKETDLKTLKLISAGRGSDMPEIIPNNHKFKRLLKKMEDVFDVIIIDTPPYGIISDSTSLLKYAEATVLVAQYRKTNKGMLLKTMEELKQINANVTNIVLNNFNHRDEVSTYYGNGYYQAMYRSYEQYK